MSRTNIEIDDELIAAVMRDHHLRTKRDAVDFALRNARRRAPLTPEEILALRGSDFWDGDLETIKTSRRLDAAGRSDQA
jgi:Arc/MetJ family transcription regulator